MPAPALATEDILEKLVGFDTTSSKSNSALIDWVENHLTGLGLSPVRVPDPVQDKASIFVTIGPRDRAGVCLSGHTDVVPVEGQAWTSDPFTLTAREGRLYGRGTCDMKGFLAACLARVPAMQVADLASPIHLILSYDEEITCEGVVHAIRRFGHDLPMPKAVIVGEPTGMRVATAHKSAVGLVTTITGKECHSSRPDDGANSVVAGAMMVAEMERIAAEFRERGDPSGLFDPPFTTVHVGKFVGGTARNIVPKTTVLNWEFRGLPTQDPDEVPRRMDAFVANVVLPYLRRTAPEATVVTVPEFAVPGVRPEPGSLAETLALTLSKTNHTITVGYATEGGQFQRVGIPTVICGPGSIEQAHKPDEWIAVEELRKCEAFIDGLIEKSARGL